MRRDLHYTDRATGKEEKERVYGRFFLHLLYGNRFFSLFVLPLIACFPCFSRWYGRKQKGVRSRKKILPFIERFRVDRSEFVDSVETFASFNDFFIRKLKKTVRPVTPGEHIVTFPADGRHAAYPEVCESTAFRVKGRSFAPVEFLQDAALADAYASGSALISRLSPSDCHRFHFPCSCTPGKARLIKGSLYSVNPFALERRYGILCENKRMITELKTALFGTILYVEVGATFVGSVRQTYSSDQPVEKGEEKGYFEFGGSCIVLLFLPGKLLFDEDLIATPRGGQEVKANMGERCGQARRATEEKV
ncbi:MAG: archaetidylserine decarboxylase [Simkaniaceae bacterium]|nr:archaetidylserine decarboxylase [Simkaniaceae bacterium]